ncbi:hypothetical protein HDE_03510 [Halotydeus destructor]|nr:hypothetical protein HDE_03510 [Halotydeus destructor]
MLFMLLFHQPLLEMELKVSNVTLDYLKYPTQSRSFISKGITATPPTLVSCFKLRQVVANLDEDEFTPNFVFTNSFDVEHVIDNCTIRSPKTYYLDDYKPCEGHFTVEKFTKHRYMCYSFRPMHTEPYYSYYITNGYYAPRYYKISLNRSFALYADKNYIYTHDRKARYFRGQSQSYTELFRPLSIRSNRPSYSIHSYVTLSYVKYESTLKEAPYDTNCYNYIQSNFTSQSRCYEDCVRQATVREHNLIPFSIVVYDKTDIPYVTRKLYRNETLALSLYKIEHTCNLTCSYPDCNDVDYIPVVITTEGLDHLLYDMYVTNEPITRTVFIAKFGLQDYAIYISTCISFWFGFSPLYFMASSEKLIRKRLKRKNTEPRWVAFYPQHFRSQ